MRLFIDEKYEGFMMKRISREKKHGSLIRIKKNVFDYKIEVTDTYEMMPWLRTFIGRLIRLSGTNKKAIKTFYDDLDFMYDMYDLKEINDNE